MSITQTPQTYRETQVQACFLGQFRVAVEEWHQRALPECVPATIREEQLGKEESSSRPVRADPRTGEQSYDEHRERENC